MSHITHSRRSCFVRRSSRLFVALLGCTLATHRAHGNDEASRFPDYSDDSTAALWLFDEPLDPSQFAPKSITPWYYTQTLTDASRNYYDLHRLHGGAIEEGRFGRALRVNANSVGAGIQLATNFASEPRTYGVFLPADHEFVPGSAKENDSVANFFWYTVQPDKFVDAFCNDQWTAEFWIRFAQEPNDKTCLIDAGQGRQIALQIELIRNTAACRIIVPSAKTAIECDLKQANINDKGWHHFALTKQLDRPEVTAFIDGKHFSTTRYEPIAGRQPSASKPGLVMRTFDAADFGNPKATTTVPGCGSSLDKVGRQTKSIRLRGWIKSPASGEVRFETDEASGLHFDVDHRPLIYGWFGRAAMYRRSPRWGTIQLKKGELYPVFIEMQHGDGDAAFAEQRLYWSWDGHSKELIPDSAWTSSDADQLEADEDGGGSSPEALMKTRFNLTLGSDRSGKHAFDGWLDEVRISTVARYTKDFTPTSHSMNYGPTPPVAAKPNGPPLLFDDTSNNSDPLPLGSRKHVLIDDALISSMNGVKFVVNRPSAPKTLQPQLPRGDHSFFELDNKVALFAPAGYEGREDFAHLWIADDGVHFRLHDAIAPRDGTQKPQAIRTDVPAWGRMAIDDNPTAPTWARFKYTAGVPHRGIYLLVSPDAVHWRRNETIMLQVGTGGESHWYWDDQVGEYRYLLKWDHGPGGRQSVEADTRQCFEPWPLARTGDSAKDLATPLGYMPARFAPDEKLGEVYRSRGTKYQWAPDVYLAFLWRFDKQSQARQVELAVSRDGTRWTHFGGDWYMPAEFEYEGQQIHEVTSVDGMIRRGEEIWQYADYSTGRHDGTKPGWRVRLTQRLDGFVSLDAGNETGSVVTKPFTFQGSSLKLNIATAPQGNLRAALLDEKGQVIAGFSLDDCEPVAADSTHAEVAWKSGRNLSELAGKPVRLQIQYHDAKLYAFQFNQK